VKISGEKEDKLLLELRKKKKEALTGGISSRSPTLSRVFKKVIIK